MVIIFILLIPATYKFIDTAILKYSAIGAQTLENKGYIAGVKIQDLNFGNAELDSLNTIRWTDINSKIAVKKKNQYISNQEFTVHVSQLTFRLINFFEKKILITAIGLEIFPPNEVATDQARYSEGVQNGKFSVAFEFDYFKPHTAKEQLNALVKSLATIISDGKTRIPIDFSCISFFTLNNEPAKAKITTMHDNQGYYRLVANKEFFKTMAWHSGDNITDAEAQVLALNPFKLPRLLKIMGDARVESERYKRNPAVPEDAYRHVLWSYLLTKEYGPEFAKIVTDSHEEGDMTNTEAEHRMDYANNTIGREYALNNYNQNEVLRRLLNDSRVVRSPR